MQYVNLGWILVQKKQKAFETKHTGTMGKTEYGMDIR